MADVDPLLDAYEHALRSILDATDGLGEEHWRRPTRCPGWDVHDQVAHVVGLEFYLAGDALPPEAPATEFIRNRVGAFMQRAVYARRGDSPERLRTHLAAVLGRRRAQLRDRTLDDEMPGLLGRPTALRDLLPLRVYDVWAHEQDIRTAVGRPGGLTGPAAEVSWTKMADGVISAMEQAETRPGGSVRIEVTGARPAVMVVGSDPDGRVSLGDVGAGGATATVTLDWTDLIARMCGRDVAEDTFVAIDGDRGLAERVLAGLAMTP